MARVYYHIGLHKTATTFLQNQFFPLLPLTYIKGTCSYTDALRCSDNADVVLFSDENMTGRLFCGDKFSDFERIVTSINKVHPDAGIIIGFRKHKDFVLSSYKQFLHEGGCIEQKDFFNADDRGILKVKDIMFENYISFIKKRFSKVMIYTIDDVKDIDSFNGRLSDFIGIEKVQISLDKCEENRGVKTNAQVRSLALLNKLNDWMIRALGIDVLYSRIFKFLRITPRHICQRYLPDIGTDYQLDKDINDFITKEFAADWKFVIDSKREGK